MRANKLVCQYHNCIWALRRLYYRNSAHGSRGDINGSYYDAQDILGCIRHSDNFLIGSKDADSHRDSTRARGIEIGAKLAIADGIIATPQKPQ